MWKRGDRGGLIVSFKYHEVVLLGIWYMISGL